MCTGTCGGVAIEEQWKQGAKACAAKDCPMHGKPLVKRLYCPRCGVHFEDAEEGRRQHGH